MTLSALTQNIPILGDHREQGCGFTAEDKLEGVQKGAPATSAAFTPKA
jgi:hypothetical protein